MEFDNWHTLIRILCNMHAEQDIWFQIDTTTESIWKLHESKSTDFNSQFELCHNRHTNSMHTIGIVGCEMLIWNCLRTLLLSVVVCIGLNFEMVIGWRGKNEKEMRKNWARSRATITANANNSSLCVVCTVLLFIYSLYKCGIVSLVSFFLWFNRIQSVFDYNFRCSFHLAVNKWHAWICWRYGQSKAGM